MNPRNYDYGQRIIPWTLTPILEVYPLVDKTRSHIKCDVNKNVIDWGTKLLDSYRSTYFCLCVHIFSSYLYDWFLSITLCPQQKSLMILSTFLVSLLTFRMYFYFYFPFILTGIPFPHRHAIPFMRFHEFPREDGADILNWWYAYENVFS